ncbi:MAG: ATP-binding cassette domain-containing protein [Pseudolabrys sp.]|nr:ATP-binding cassette domain-containing protein [Pseudolabrys sp.]
MRDVANMTTSSDLAIQLEGVSKVYKLHGSQRDQLIEVLGLQRYGLRPRSPAKQFSALSSISLAVRKGQRLGIVGRNGSGKTTLLKLICGNFAPSAGEITVSGRVQALMSVGIGFHPDFTGRENVEASLHYNGLKRQEHKEALAGIIDFCELGEFIDQPFKTYSLGMQARLMFATATAVEPEILIVDEVLGAGDAYFVAKSKKRVDRLISGGCTMLLVSHSMGQILELCDKVIWLDQGRVRMEGEPLEVVKCYEEYLQRSVGALEPKERVQEGENGSEIPVRSRASDLHHPSSGPAEKLNPARMQIPYFVPHLVDAEFPNPPAPNFDQLAPGGLSRWVEEPKLEIVGVTIQTIYGPTGQFICLEPGRFVIDLEVKSGGRYRCCYGIAIHDHLGNCMLRLFSPPDSFEGVAGNRRQVAAVLNPCQLGPGEYTVGISVTEHLGIEFLNQGDRYDLLSRSLILKVVLPDSIGAATACFLHTSEWAFGEGRS